MAVDLFTSRVIGHDELLAKLPPRVAVDPDGQRFWQTDDGRPALTFCLRGPAAPSSPASTWLHVTVIAGAVTRFTRFGVCRVEHLLDLIEKAFGVQVRDEKGRRLGDPEFAGTGK